MDIAYGGTSKAPTIYMCVDDESLYFGATAEINPATYTDNTDIDFNLVRGSVDNDKLQDWANGDLYVSILMWDDMVYNSIGASMKAFGFTKF
ncbi:MAG: hypothetical protein IJ725_06190 [Ruminococcus sp.]|nr:hypothetical protein [Ruminococcus sp.]